MALVHSSIFYLMRDVGHTTQNTCRKLKKQVWQIEIERTAPFFCQVYYVRVCAGNSSGGVTSRIVERPRSNGLAMISRARLRIDKDSLSHNCVSCNLKSSTSSCPFKRAYSCRKASNCALKFATSFITSGIIVDMYLLWILT